MKGNESIVVDYTFAEPPHQVWRALTEPTLLSQWLMMSTDIQPVVGHKFTFREQPRGDWDGIVYCRMLEVDPPRKLVYSWEGGSEKDGDTAPRLETTVTWTLTPTPSGGTSLHLVHYGFRPDDHAFEVIGSGWRSMLTAEKMTRMLSATPA